MARRWRSRSSRHHGFRTGTGYARMTWQEDAPRDEGESSVGGFTIEDLFALAVKLLDLFGKGGLGRRASLKTSMSDEGRPEGTYPSAEDYPPKEAYPLGEAYPLKMGNALKTCTEKGIISVRCRTGGV